MTTNYHVPMSGVDVASPINFNSRFSDLDSAITNIGNSSANSIQVTVGEGVAVRQAGFIDLDDGLGYLLDADSATPKAGTIRGFWTSTEIATATGTLQISGLMSGFAGLTAGEPVYVDTVAGTITQTRPSPASGGSQIAIMQMGIAVSTTEILIRPLPVQYQKRNALSDTDTLSISHHGDTNGYRRNIWAYITETVAGTETEGYTDSNQDSDVVLRSTVVATYTTDKCVGGTATASSHQVTSTTYSADKAFDNIDAIANSWVSSVDPSTTPQWIEYEFLSAVEIRRMRLMVTSLLEARGPADFEFQSYNGSSWDTIGSAQSSITWSASVYQDFDLPSSTARTRWRVYITASQAGEVDCILTEIEMLEAATYSADLDKLAQTFTLSGSTDIASVGLWLKKVGSPTGTATVRIETVSGSDPTGTLADSAATITFSESGLGTSYAEKLLTFASEFTLGAGTYAIVLSTDRATSGTDYIIWGADGSAPSYAGGDMRSEASAVWSAESKDAVFSVYEPGITHPSRVSVDWWSSTYADMVNRYGDGSGNSLSSQTTFKCVRTAGFDDITVVVELP